MNASNDLHHRHWPSQLANGLAAMQQELTVAQQGKLLDYLSLLYKWNKVYNLTAVRDLDRAVSRQLLDSLSILPWVEGPRVIDVGTGAGLPGIPLAVVLPDIEFILLDSNGKKTRFIQQAIAELGLRNVRVEQNRVERFEDASRFNTIVSRAFADLHLMLDLTAHLLVSGGCWAAMKSGVEELDADALPATCQYQVHDLQVPGETGKRRLVHIRR